jgi:threonine aldolase
VHLDGARLFNASVGAGIAPAEWARHADSVQICFSKGLGCPLGAIVAGPSDFIERAWESKYLFGGAMRQAGVIAAAALYALDHNVDRLAEDHARARRLAEGIGLDGNEVETNFVEIQDPGDGIERLQRQGVLVSDLRPGFMRAVTHLGVTDDDIDRAIELIPRALAADRVHA